MGRARLRLLRPLIPLLLGGGVVLSTPVATLAECTNLSPWPSFTDAVTSADRVVVGRVVGLTPESGRDQAGQRIPINDFRLEVEEVLRGEAPTNLEFHGLRSGAPTPTCRGESVLWVRLDDRVVFAFGAHLAGRSRPITAVAFVDSSRPIRFLNPRIEQLTLTQIEDLVRLPATDMTARIAEDAVPIAGTILALIGVVGFAGGWRLRRNRTLIPARLRR